jgi:hypothetical protein
METKPPESTEEKGDGAPVCINCFRPVDPLSYYCPHCGEATGQFTQYLPVTNIPWQASVWGRMWRQVLSRDVSIPGRIFRLLMILWQAPILLIGLIFRDKKESTKELSQNDSELNHEEIPPPQV